jgi:hypothetical protein
VIAPADRPVRLRLKGLWRLLKALAMKTICRFTAHPDSAVHFGCASAHSFTALHVSGKPFSSATESAVRPNSSTCA